MIQETAKLHFQPVTLSMREMIYSYLKPLRIHHSQYSFPTMIMWGQGKHIHVAEEEDKLYILYTFPNYVPYMLMPLCRKEKDYPLAIQTAQAYMRSMGMQVDFRGIPEEYTSYFIQMGFALEEDRDNFDYVYQMESLRTLSGKKLHGKRNHINQFLSQYSFTYTPITPDMYADCIRVYNTWLEGKDPSVVGIQGEQVAIDLGLKHMAELNLVGGGILMDGQLKAFSLGEKVDDEMAIIYFEKADGDIPGLYPLINREFVSHAWQDVKYINREEDMGLEGLRRAKLSYAPAYLLKEYKTVRAQ